MKNNDVLILENLYEGIYRKGRCLDCGCLLTEEEMKKSKDDKNLNLLSEGKTDCNGVVIYHGQSRGENVVCIATGFVKPSDNAKTGPMVQVWILNSDVSPIEAIKTGKDVGICFNCIHRGGTCYVNAAQGPNAVYKAFKNGSYPSICDESTDFTKGDIAQTYLQNGAWDVFQNSFVRFGAYGDPVVIPFPILEKIANNCKGFTGYTHQWKEPTFDVYKKYLMASVDMPKQYDEAKAKGWRTFRVTHDWKVKSPNEQPCLNSRDGTACINCLKCGGTSVQDKDIYIKVHGLKHKVNKFIEKFGKGDFAEPLTDEDIRQIAQVEERENAEKTDTPSNTKLSALDKLRLSQGINKKISDTQT